ncbi:MAG: hypothetical protein DRP56_07695 [Planctomycetota bacterium]|nr:MAG: hypothetical protein DRP56_07695 [Planctomycetota bacterium]
MELSFQEKRPLLIPGTIAAVMLFLALAPWPYGYYQLLRLIVCSIAVYFVVTTLHCQKNWAIWLFGFIAILFNPLIPIYLTREIWIPVDMVCGILFIVSGMLVKNRIGGI